MCQTGCLGYVATARLWHQYNDTLIQEEPQKVFNVPLYRVEEALTKHVSYSESTRETCVNWPSNILEEYQPCRLLCLCLALANECKSTRFVGCARSSWCPSRFQFVRLSRLQLHCSKRKECTVKHQSVRCDFLMRLASGGVSLNKCTLPVQDDTKPQRNGCITSEYSDPVAPPTEVHLRANVKGEQLPTPISTSLPCQASTPVKCGLIWRCSAVPSWFDVYERSIA